MSSAAADQTSNSLLTTKDLSLSIGGKQLLQNLNLDLVRGTRLGILGQNGTGKTTLLHALVNLITADSGDIYISGKSIVELTRMELARKTGILLQQSSDEMPATAMEFVLTGRHPHLPTWRWESSQDQKVAQQALALMQIETLAQRDIRSLSGGERQRLAIATLLTQEPEIYLLDEPGNHLDIAMQIKSLEILTSKVKSKKSALIMATHDINLAARFCDQILLFLGDGRYILGKSEDVLSTENLSLAYDCDIGKARHENGYVYFPI